MFLNSCWEQNEKCLPKLTVEDQDMRTSSSETYLGDILTDNGKIDLNIQSRYDKAFNSIFSYLREICFGQNFFSMAMLFRSSMLLIKMLSISEVLYGIKEKHQRWSRICHKFVSSCFVALFDVVLVVVIVSKD